MLERWLVVLECLTDVLECPTVKLESLPDVLERFADVLERQAVVLEGLTGVLEEETDVIGIPKQVLRLCLQQDGFARVPHSETSVLFSGAGEGGSVPSQGVKNGR